MTEALDRHLQQCDEDFERQGERMTEPWVARTCWDGSNARFELHIGGNIYALSLEKGKRLAEYILCLLREEDDIPF